MSCSDRHEKGELLPIVSSVFPPTAEIGDTIVLVGERLADIIALRFSNSDAKITYNTQYELRTIVPANADIGNQAITLTNVIYGTTYHLFTVVASVPPPAISGIDPELGIVGTEVTITGTNLAYATDIAFGTTIGCINVATDTSITTSVPVGAAIGPQTVTVTTPGGIATHEFTVTASADPAPTIISVDPENMRGVAGDLITVVGSHLKDATITFGDLEATPLTSTDTKVSFIVPEGAETGPITITTDGGKVQTEKFTIEVRLYVHDDAVHEENGFMVHNGNDYQMLDRINNEQVIKGENAIKFTVASGVSGQFGFEVEDIDAGMSTSGYTYVVFSVYGALNTGALRFSLRVPDSNEAEIAWVPIEPAINEWTTFYVPITALGSMEDEEGTPSGEKGDFIWYEMMFQNDASIGGTDPKTYYIDNIYFLKQ